MSLQRHLVGLFGITLLVADGIAQTIPAFPGADGAARDVVGGRGGIVYHVTKLNSAIDDPQRNDFGTIRYGLNNANFPAGTPRTIVFDVGVVFQLGRLPQPANNWDPNGNGWDAQSRLTIGGTNITLAGQTAPGAGVIFMGGGLKPQGNNNIIRNITVASGYGLAGWWRPGVDPFPAQPGTSGASTDPAQWFPDNTVYDAMDISGTNLMIDHVSTLYATDETISMNEVANNITVQYSNISQGQNYPQWDAEGGGLTGHALGSLLEAGSTTARAAISFHHNLYAHQKGRVPQMQAGGLGAYYDFRNNVFYNWFGTAGSKSGTTYLNLVNNFYLAGDGGDQPAGGTNPNVNTSGGGTGVISASSSIHRTGNLLDSNKDADANDGVALSAGGAANPLWANGVVTYAGVTDSANQAFSRVLDYVGANWWNRDAVIDSPDERIIQEARTGTGKIQAWADNPWNNDPAEGAEWRALKNTPQANRAIDWDTEPSIGYGVGDGMPSWWEVAHGLDPAARDDAADFDSDGYTNLEEYLNEVAAWPAPGPIVFAGATNSRYAQITNWDANPATGAVNVHNWQPSRFDEAQINTGTVVVDAVGQHARVLKVGATAASSATLQITGGWLAVENELNIGGGAGSSATVALSGGGLVAPVLSKGAGGQFQFTGGRLQTSQVQFSLTNNGGTLAAVSTAGGTQITGDFTTTAGAIELELTSLTQFDKVAATGAVTLGGALQVLLDGSFTPTAGDSFTVLTGASVAGAFTNLSPNSRVEILNRPGASFLVSTTTGAVTLSGYSLTIAGDFNSDGAVDAADYTTWRDGLGSIYTTADYEVWRIAFSGGAATTSAASVPEPSALLVATTILLGVYTRRAKSNAHRVFD